VKSNLFDQEATVLQFNMRAMEDREENLSFYFSLNIIIIANVVLGIAAIALIVIIGMGMYVTLQIILLL
jgi:hypothetical protein